MELVTCRLQTCPVLLAFSPSYRAAPSQRLLSVDVWQSAKERFSIFQPRILGGMLFFSYGVTLYRRFGIEVHSAIVFIEAVDGRNLS